MQSVNWPVALCLFVFMAATACNNSVDKTRQPGGDTTLVDSAATVVKDNLPVKDTAAEPEDFTKRDINLTLIEWQQFQHAHGLKADLQNNAGKVTGDFNGDGKQAIWYMIAPKEDTITRDAFQECIGGCDAYLVSADTGYTILKVHNNLGGEVKNIGDIDGDGADDIMVYPSWWQSSWNAYRIYSINRATRQWAYLIEPVSIFANELDKNIAFVRKSAKPGFISAYNSTVDAEGNLHSGYNNYKMIK